MKYTVNVDSADDARIEEAFSNILNLGRPATPTDIEKAMFNWLEGQTHDYERRKNMSSFTPVEFVE
jgi:hypothetical protein